MLHSTSQSFKIWDRPMRSPSLVYLRFQFFKVYLFTDWLTDWLTDSFIYLFICLFIIDLFDLFNYQNCTFCQDEMSRVGYTRSQIFARLTSLSWQTFVWHVVDKSSSFSSTAIYSSNLLAFPGQHRFGKNPVFVRKSLSES